MNPAINLLPEDHAALQWLQGLRRDGSKAANLTGRVTANLLSGLPVNDTSTTVAGIWLQYMATKPEHGDHPRDLHRLLTTIQWASEGLDWPSARWLAINLPSHTDGPPATGDE